MTGPSSTSTTAVDVDALIAGPQYAAFEAHKQENLLGILRPLLQTVGDGCPPYGRFLSRLGPPPWASLWDIPPLPVGVFKRQRLLAVPEESLHRVLLSSATTGDTPSWIPVDQTTAFRQTRALSAIVKDRIGSSRRPFLVLDVLESVAPGHELTARGAAIRGLQSFARSTTFALRRGPTGEPELDREALERFAADVGGGPALVFGFTFLVWSRVVLALEEASASFALTGATLLHSGGWKKLREAAVDRRVFGARTAAALGIPESQIVDFYGMVEQVGTVFLDCAAENKHAPAFATVLIRRPGTLTPVDIGEVGLIEVVSVLPTSYPGHAIITEDLGRLMGVDSCPCGRRGVFFRFERRVERAPVRGCGDVAAGRGAS